MYTIKTLNAISPVGLAKLNKNLFDVSVGTDAPGLYRLYINGEEHPLRRGETFYLHGRSFHLLKNVRKTTARVLWVSTPPLF